MKRFAGFVALLVFSVLGFSFITSTSASAADLTWTGAGDGTTTNDQNNWTPAQAPAAGDTLILPPISGVASKQITFNTSANVGIIYFSRTSGIKTDYTVSGSVVARQITADSDAKVNFSTDTLEFGQYNGAPTTPFNISSEGDTVLVINSSSIVLNTGTVSSLNIDGDGLAEINTSSFATSHQFSGISVNGPRIILGGSTTSVPNINLTVKQNADLRVNNIAWLGANTILETSASIGMPAGSQIGSNNVVVHEGSLIYSIAGYTQDDIVFTENSRLAIMGNASFRSTINNVDLVIKGNICNVTLDINCDNSSNGRFKIMPTNDSYGAVVVNQVSGKENASDMVNGEIIEPPYQTEVISGNNSGDINVRPYKIIVLDGSADKVTVSDKGILKGTGTIAELEVEAGGRVAPGQSPGILNVGNTTFAADSTFEVEIAGNEVGSEYDQLKVTGTINLGDSNLDAILLNSFKPEAGSKFVIVDNDGNDAIEGTFRDLSEGARLTIDGVDFTISYAGGDGNDVELTVIGTASDSAASAPGVPNTGIKMLLANPLLTMLGSTLSAAGLFILARKYKTFAG